MKLDHLQCRHQRVRERRNAFTYSAAARAFEEGGAWVWALELHRAMGQAKVEVDTIACNAAMRAGGEGGV